MWIYPGVPEAFEPNMHVPAAKPEMLPDATTMYLEREFTDGYVDLVLAHQDAELYRRNSSEIPFLADVALSGKFDGYQFEAQMHTSEPTDAPLSRMATFDPREGRFVAYGRLGLTPGYHLVLRQDFGPVQTHEMVNRTQDVPARLTIEGFGVEPQQLSRVATAIARILRRPDRSTQLKARVELLDRGDHGVPQDGNQSKTQGK